MPQGGGSGPGCSGATALLKAGQVQGLLPIAAVAQGDDPSVAYREHAVGAVVPAPAVLGVDPWRPHADHDQLAAAGDLLQLGPQAVLGPVPQHLLQLVPAVADLRDGVLEAGIQIGPFHVRVDELQHRRQVAVGVGLIRASDQVLVLVRHASAPPPASSIEGDGGGQSPIGRRRSGRGRASVGSPMACSNHGRVPGRSTRPVPWRECAGGSASTEGSHLVQYQPRWAAGQRVAWRRRWRMRPLSKVRSSTVERVRSTLRGIGEGANLGDAVWWTLPFLLVWAGLDVAGRPGAATPAWPCGWWTASTTWAAPRSCV